MRVLLIKSRSLKSKVTGSTPPLGVMYLSSYIKKHLNAETRILDIKFCKDPQKAIADMVYEFRPEVVGISGLTPEAPMIHEAARVVRANSDVPIIVGGPHASANPSDVLANPAVDIAVIGEGEETFLELLRSLDKLRDISILEHIRGIAFRTGTGRIHITQARPFIEDLDSIPFPDWDAVDIHRFWTIPAMSTLGIRPYIPIFSSRGCPFQCTFCHNLFGKRFRARSPENVIAEIEEAIKRFGLVEIEFLDDIANLKRERLNAIFQGLLDRGLHPRISFPNGIRTDILDHETVSLLAKVGAGEVSVAVETASPRLQKQIRKNLDLKKVRRNIDLLVAHGIFTRGFFMLGFPTETLEEMLETINFALHSPLHVAFFFAVNPFPNTKIYEAFRNRLPSDTTYYDFEYFAAPFNGSDVPDAIFRLFYRYAYYRFYFDPIRVIRVLRDRPYRLDLPKRLWALFHNLTSFRRFSPALDRQESS